MIIKFEKYNESIKHLLVGPTEEEVSSNLRKRYDDGKIDILLYYNLCKSNGVKTPTEEDIKSVFLNGGVDLFKYLGFCKQNNFKLLSNDEMIELFKNINSNDILIKSIRHNLPIGIKYAIENGADVHLNNDSSLISSCYDMRYDTCEYLLENGANMFNYQKHPNIQIDESVFNSSPINILLKNDDEESWKLINKYYDKNNYLQKLRSQQILLLSCKVGRLDWVKYSIERGANPVNEPIYVASKRKYYDIVNYLLENGASLFDRCDYRLYDHIETVFGVLVENGDDESIYIIKKFIKK